jgi:hypothetical protein
VLALVFALVLVFVGVNVLLIVYGFCCGMGPQAAVTAAATAAASTVQYFLIIAVLLA